MGSDVIISCHSDTVTENIEWLRDGDEPVAVMPMERKLDLLFSPVNDSVHGTVYTCRVTRNGSEVAEQNFTMNVIGKINSNSF